MTDLFRGTQVRLTALCADDAVTMARWTEDAGYLRLQDTNLAVPRTAAAIAADIEGWNQAADTLVLGIHLLEGDELIGTVGFYEIEWANRVAWLGIGIGDRSRWGQGYGSEAMALTLRYAFDELNLHRVQLTVLAYNERAIALYKRCGFRQEGVFREFGLRDGRRYDMYLYGLLSTEWQARQAE